MSKKKTFDYRFRQIFRQQVWVFLVVFVIIGFCCIWRHQLFYIWLTISFTMVEYLVLMWMNIRFFLNYYNQAKTLQLKFQKKRIAARLQNKPSSVFPQLPQLPQRRQTIKKRRTKIGNSMMFCFVFKMVVILGIAILIFYLQNVFSPAAYCATILFGYYVWVVLVIYQFYFNDRKRRSQVRLIRSANKIS